MRLDERKLRSIIRKRILEQEDKDADGVPDSIDRDVEAIGQPAEASKLEVDEAATQEIRKQYVSQAKLLQKGCRTGVGLSKTMTLKKARELADALYDATEGSGDGMITGAISSVTLGLVSGIGTNEEAVQTALSDPAIQCLADLSYIAHQYEKRYPGYTLYDTLVSEYGYFSSVEFQQNVKDPIEDVLVGDPIFILSDEKYDAEKIQEMQAEAEEYSKKSDDLISRSAGEIAGEFGKGAAAAPLIMGGLSSVGAASLGFTGVGIASAALGGATAGTMGMSAGVATGAAGMGASLPVIGGTLASIPGPGWVALGVLAVGLGLFAALDSADMTEQEKYALSPDLYRKLDATFREQSKNLMEVSRSDEIIVYLPPEDVNRGGSAQDSNYPPLPSDVDGLSNNNAECIRRIQSIMNSYSSTRGLDSSIGVDGKWGPETEGAWRNPFIKHVFSNHAIFMNLGFAESVKSGAIFKWSDLSANLISTYPGYTAGLRGCLAFCLDSYYGNTRYGELNLGSERSNVKRGGDSSREEPDPNKNNKKDQKRYTSRGGRNTHKDIFIGVDFSNTSIQNYVSKTVKEKEQRSGEIQKLVDASDLESIDASLKTEISKALVGDMKGEKLSGNRGDMVQNEETFEVRIVKGRGGVRVRRVKGNAGKIFKDMRKRIREVLENTASIDPDLLDLFYDCRMTITIPRGYYTNLGSKQLQEKIIKKLIRSAIINEYMRR